jgi:hypothetical protein
LLRKHHGRCRGSYPSSNLNQLFYDGFKISL